ncbi:MAG: hypothetical protein SGI77_13905 [Pirellulaceae bacterium]|nr:hypothetical protein [Pirellulaceae bacterium]
MSTTWNSLDLKQQASWSNALSASIYICPLLKYNDVQPELFAGLEGEAFSLFDIETLKQICREIVGETPDVELALSAYQDMIGDQIDFPTPCSDIKLVHPNRLSSFRSALNREVHLTWSIGLGFFEPPNYVCRSCGNCQHSDQVRCPNPQCIADREPSNDHRDWTPELNLIAQLNLGIGQAGPQLFEFIEAYRTEAIQHSVFVVLSDNSIWQVCKNSVIQKASIRKWLFKESGPRTWTGQVGLIQRSMAFLSSERFRKEQNRAEGGLGATFLRGVDGCLEVHVAGRARYLFEACFPAILARQVETIEIDKQPLLLVDVSKAIDKEYARVVKYAVYQSGEALEHCYCGLCYPSRTREICQNEKFPIPRLRALASAWIEEKYKACENLERPWASLSSPHFYFAKKPPKSFADDAAAAEQAKREWERLLEDELCR